MERSIKKTGSGTTEKTGMMIKIISKKIKNRSLQRFFYMLNFAGKVFHGVETGLIKIE